MEGYRQLQACYTESDRTYAERLSEINTRTLMRHLPRGDNLANGRIRECQPADQAHGTQQETPRPSGSIKLAHLNVCGWTKDNHSLRENIVRAIDAAITSICETQLPGNSVIEIDNYL